MNKLDKDYQNLLKDILENGDKKMDRTGTGTLSVFGRQIRHKMSDGFPLLTTKKMYTKGIITELIWFLRGDTNIKYLVDNGCNIWNGDAYKNYKTKFEMMTGHGFHGVLMTQEEFINRIKTDDDFAKTWGDLGPIYGKQWRNWTYITREKKEDINGIDESICGIDMFDSYRYYRTFDQIANLINDLKNNPDSRRLMVNAWNVGEIDNMVLPPCHYGFECYTRELSLDERSKICWDTYNFCVSNHMGHSAYDSQGIPKRALSLKWTQRSVDTFLGLPFNIASYGLLLEILAKECNMVADELIGDLGNTHLYLNHIEQAKEQIGREMTTEERNEWFIDNWCGGNRKDCRDDYTDFELDQQCVPRETREPYKLPYLEIKLHFEQEDSFKPEWWLPSDFEIMNYKYHPAIKADLSN